MQIILYMQKGLLLLVIHARKLMDAKFVRQLTLLLFVRNVFPANILLIIYYIKIIVIVLVLYKLMKMALCALPVLICVTNVRQ